MKLALALVTLVAVGCGEEPLPVCPNGDCTLPAATVIKWRFNHYPELLFPGDTCQDVGAQLMVVEATGIDDPTVYDVKELDCTQAQATFLGLPQGRYTIGLTALDGGGNPIVSAPTTKEVMAGVGTSGTLETIDIPYESLTGSYTGTLLFRLSWAGASCEAAVPPVAMQTLTLMVNGGAVATALTDVGQALDGSDPIACRLMSEPFAQFAEGLAFGPATFIVTGHDGGGAVAFEHTFETFVGAAKNNPTITFDVPVVPPAM